MASPGGNGAGGASPPGHATAVRRILALGGHDFSSRPPDRAVCELLLRLAGERGAERPRICILPTASGDTSELIAHFYAAFGERSCEPSDVSLFRLGRRPMALRDHLLSQDLIYVGGGSLVNLLAVWEAHDIASMLSLAWRRGVVLAGQSAGAMCWFEAGITTSSGRPRAAAGLGLLRGSLCVHYNNEPERRAAYLDAVGKGMPDGYGLDDHAGLLWEGEESPAAVTARRGARAYRVCRRESGVTESPLPARFLPAPAPAALREDIAEYRRLKSMHRRAGWLG
ncbi:MAG: Type 1 glutamine amidotransferase-like domain-containing protein [Syntrophothermus sp.]